MSAPVTLFVPDGNAAPEGARVLREASADGASGALVEVALSDLPRSVGLVVVDLDDGRRALALADRWDHSSLAVDDLDVAIGFYRTLLGFEIDFEERGMDAQIASITGVSGLICDLAQLHSPLTGHTLELIAFHTPVGAPDGHAPLRPGQGHAAFQVEDLEAALAEVERLGGQLLGEVTQFEDGRSAYCREPAGSYLELTEPAARAARGRA